MTLLLMIAYIIFLFIVVRKYKENKKQYKSNIYLSIIFLGLVNTILILSESITGYPLYIRVIANLEEFYLRFIALLCLGSSLIAFLGYLEHINEN